MTTIFFVKVIPSKPMAVMVMTFRPGLSGTVALHAFAPLAVKVLFPIRQVTLFTVPVVVPRMTIFAFPVESWDLPTTVSEGGAAGVAFTTALPSLAPESFVAMVR